MPVLTAFQDHPTRPYVRLEGSWADTPSVDFARVLRVDSATGECVALRPYVCYSNEYLALSCGHGLWWDTEAPFDREFYYLTQGLDAPCVPGALAVQDSFARNTANGWGVPPIGGGPYTLNGGVAGDYSTTTAAGGLAGILVNAPSTTKLTRVGPTIAAVRLRGAVRPEQVATGGPFDLGYLFRSPTVTDRYEVLVRFETAATTRLRLVRSGTLVADVALPYAYNGVSSFAIRVEADGAQIRARAWEVSLPDPVAWQIDVTDSTPLVAGGQVGGIVRVQAGNTNNNTPHWEYLEVEDMCKPCVPTTAQTPTLSIPSDGRFWLKDPVRPCNDQPVPLCQASAPLLPDCGGDGGILFVGVTADVYASNGYSLRPNNRRRNIAITRPRSDAASSLRLQTLTFDDRDDLVALLAPGSPLLFQGPQNYGVPDRYMDIAPVPVSPELSDLRIQVRTEVLPYNTVDRPVGPTQGICGARVADICDQFPTVQSAIDAGLSYDDLLRVPGLDPDARTWDDVNSEFADWNAVNTGGRDWAGLQAGD